MYSLHGSLSPHFIGRACKMVGSAAVLNPEDIKCWARSLSPLCPFSIDWRWTQRWTLRIKLVATAAAAIVTTTRSSTSTKCTAGRRGESLQGFCRRGFWLPSLSSQWSSGTGSSFHSWRREQIIRVLWQPQRPQIRTVNLRALVSLSVYISAQLSIYFYSTMENLTEGDKFPHVLEILSFDSMPCKALSPKYSFILCAWYYGVAVVITDRKVVLGGEKGAVQAVRLTVLRVAHRVLLFWFGFELLEVRALLMPL